MEEIINDVSNSDPRDRCSTDNNLDLNLESPQAFGIRDEVELKTIEDVSNPINIDVDIEIVDVEVEIELTTNLELKPILNESVHKSIHFLTLIEEVLAKKFDEFISFSFDEEDKAQATKSSHEMEGRKLEPIIPQKII